MVREGTMLLPAWLLEVCLGESCLLALAVSNCFTFSSYATSALPTVALVLNPREGESAEVLSPCGPFKRSLLKIQQFLPCRNPHWFVQPEIMGIYLPGAGTLGCVVWPGVVSLLPKYPS